MSHAMMSRSYADSIAALNTLQSNFAIVDAIRKSGKKMNEQAIPEMIEWLRRIGYQPSHLNALNPIHIAGTKGKGSTAAFISSILNQFREARVQSAPKKIGLYTSPHLRFVRERIQINGQPLTEDEFARYFFETWDRLEASAAQAGEDPQAPTSKPVYFRFLTLMAFHTYLSESVDCAIIECGIGGAYDSTNIIPNPAVAGITSLGIDHVGVLGSTIEEIAWHKAGIMKEAPDSIDSQRLKCFTPSSQSTAAKAVLSDVAAQKSTDLIFTDISPEIASGSFPLGLSAPFQQTNASLALAIASSFLSLTGIDTSTEQSKSHIRQGLQSVSWPGRCDTRVDKIDARITWYIDGGHTLESIELAGKWFGEELRTKRLKLEKEDGAEPKTRRKLKTYLIFNQQTRDAPSLATALYNTLSSTLTTVPTQDTQNSASTNSSITQSDAGSVSTTSSNTASSTRLHTNSNPDPSTSSASSPFTTVIFTTNTPYSQSTSNPVSITGTTTTITPSPQPSKKQSADLISTNIDSTAIEKLTVQKSLAETYQRLDPCANVHVVRSVEDAINMVRNDVVGPGSGYEETDFEIEKVVLVTGSLHLVGAVLEVLEGGS